MKLYHLRNVYCISLQEGVGWEMITAFGNTIRTSWITLPHILFWELITVVATPRITPNNFLRRPQDRRYLRGSASLFGIAWKVSVAIFVVRASSQT